MRVLIVDDEPAARERLRIMLEELDIETVGEAENGLRALEMVRERKPDVVLLDIAMPDVDGLDVARHLPEPRPLIVFQTAHADYALDAFEQEALDYVVKPVKLDRLRRALERAARRIEARAPTQVSTALLESLGAVVGERESVVRRRRVLVQEGTGFRLLAFSDVLLFNADAGVVWAVTAERRFPTTYTLNELEARTAGAFVRISRAELVALERIQRIEPAGDGGGTLTLNDGRRLRISRRRMTEVKEALES